jgi:hypothetical protein
VTLITSLDSTLKPSPMSFSPVLSTFLTGLLQEHGCSKFEAVVVDRACPKLHSRIFLTIPVSSATTLSSNSLHSGSAHSSARWESIGPSPIGSALPLDRHHQHLKPQPALRQRSPGVNHQSVFKAGSSARNFGDAATRSTLEKKSGLPACPIRKLSRESSLPPGGEEEERQEHESSGTENRRLGPWKYPQPMQAFLPVCDAAGRTVPQEFGSPSRTVGETSNAGNDGASPSLPCTSTSSTSTSSRPPLSPKKTTKTPSSSATVPCTSRSAATGRGICKRTLVQDAPRFGNHRDPKIVLPTLPLVAPAPVRVRSTSTHAIQELETICARISDGFTERTKTTSVSPSPDAASDNASTLGHRITDTSNKAISKRLSSEPSTDYQGRPHTGRSLSKTLGVDFQELAPVQPMRRPSSEPEHRDSTFDRSTPLSFSFYPNLSESQSDTQVLTLLPDYPSEPSSAPTRLDFLPYPLCQVSEHSTGATSSTVSTHTSSNHISRPASKTFGARGKCGAGSATQVNNDGRLRSALFRLDEAAGSVTTSTGSSPSTHHPSIHDIVLEPVSNRANSSSSGVFPLHGRHEDSEYVGAYMSTSPIWNRAFLVDKTNVETRHETKVDFEK